MIESKQRETRKSKTPPSPTTKREKKGKMGRRKEADSSESQHSPVRVRACWCVSLQQVSLGLLHSTFCSAPSTQRTGGDHIIRQEEKRGIKRKKLNPPDYTGVPLSAFH